MSWEADKASLVLKVTDGAKETTWRLRKNMGSAPLITIFNEVLNSLWETGPAPWEPKPLIELVRTVDDVELAELREDAEKASRAAQQAAVDKLSRGAIWWNNDDDLDEEIMFSKVAELPDYDSGEIK